MKQRKGFIHLYMGTGKGKTTAALGLALRAIGAGLEVEMIQFMKGDQSNERKIIKHLSGFSTTSFGRDAFITAENHEPIDETLARKGLDFAQQLIDKESCDILILDEITVAVAFHLLKKEDVLDVLSRKPADMTIILTGRVADESLISLADVVTNMREIKHPYQYGESAQPGIDY
jgi:cob(I)alamin adenosyltransferase